MDSRNKDELLSRRNFLSGLKKWSKVVIAGAVGIGVGSKANAGSWVNRRGGAGWANRGGGGWVNRSGGGGWINRSGGGSWANRRGLGGWLNGR